jgi:molecular chaperone GrpE
MDNQTKSDHQAAPQENLNELELCKKTCDEYLNNWKRERADFVNYKKGEVERVGLITKYAKEDILFNVLPVLDSIYLAQNHIPEDIKKNNWSQGFMQIQYQITEFLKQSGIEAIKTIGQPFDPATMEALGHTEEKEGQSGLVIEELQKGYIMDGKLIRPAKVKINK